MLPGAAGTVVFQNNGTPLTVIRTLKLGTPSNYHNCLKIEKFVFSVM